MNENVKKTCKNFNSIVNCEFLEDDLFSQILVDYYKKAAEATKDDETSLKKISTFDYVMRKYIEDYNFSKKLQDSIDVSSLVNNKSDISLQVLEYVTAFSIKYDEDKEEIIGSTRWI